MKMEILKPPLMNDKYDGIGYPKVICKDLKNEKLK